ncbi:MAG TPA: IS30 family transposase [Candidatus Deferrimicrobium sp.]|nr:IS30 family transposase [Candidatus Deferrimicrobium sp.]
MGQRRTPRRLTQGQAREIRRLAARGTSEREIVERIGVSKGSIWRTLRPRARPVPAVWQPRRGRLSLGQRIEIAVGLLKGDTFTAIAGGIGVRVSTVSREIGGRAARGQYNAEAAHQLARRRALRPKLSKFERNAVLRERVLDDLELWWSPQQIAARLRRDFPTDPEMWVSHETIYKSLFVQGKGALRREVAACLRSGRATRRPRALSGRPRGILPNTVPISERPPEADDRAVPGHWEGDLIFGKGHTQAIGTLVERNTRFVLLFQPTSYTAEAVRIAMTATIQTLPKELFKTLAWDRGAEMARHERFTIDTGVQVFFCDPHSPWQRGTNENTNGLLRQYFPKGSDFSVLTPSDLAAAAASLNNRPRQTLDWLKPAEALERLLALTG